VRGLREAPPAFLFFGVFTGFEGVFDRVRSLVEGRYGPIDRDGESAASPFPETRTYARTMGAGLLKKLFVVERLWPQDRLAEAKLAAIEMEDAVHRSGAFPVERPVNIDPGLVNDCRVVLASTKDYSHRLYRGQGIWEEVSLVFQEGAWRPLPWTYPDLRAPTYHAFLSGFRERLLEHIRTLRRSGPPPAPCPPP
jgi:hypothetical protein